MKARDILILAGLILLILALTLAQRYARHQGEIRRQQETVMVHQQWEEGIMAVFEARWADVSGQLRAALDSMAQAVMAAGVAPESLAVVVVGSLPQAVPPSGAPPNRPQPLPSRPPRPGINALLAREVSREYEAALAALPHDLNTYERHLATNDVAALIRARFGITTPQFDSLLKQAGERP